MEDVDAKVVPPSPTLQPIHVTPTNLPPERSSSKYDMKTKRGTAIIFNHFTYPNHHERHENRLGTDKDLKAVADSLERKGFKVRPPCNDFTYDQIYKELQKGKF